MFNSDNSAASSIELHFFAHSESQKLPAVVRNNRKKQIFLYETAWLVNCGNFLLFHNYDKTTHTTTEKRS